MHILLVAATSFEIAAVTDFLDRHNYRYNHHTIDAAITGVGSISTTYHLTEQVNANRPDYLIQAGIAGSFSPIHPPGSIVIVQEEIVADTGVEENGVWTDLFDMKLQESIMPYTGKALVNPYCTDWERYGLPLVKGITINEITTQPNRIQQWQQKYSPVVESMEGAAFHYTALMEDIPFLQLRSISNYVGERDKAKWKMKEAIEGLNEMLIKMLSEWSVVSGEYTI